LAHKLKPVVFIGQKGIGDTVLKSTGEALEKHELIKVKFIEFKEKDSKKEIAGIIEEKLSCELVGMIGHMAIFYKQHHDHEKRKITLPA